jgi:hypothetical protein
MTIELDPTELDMLIGILGETLDNLEMSDEAIATASSIYQKLIKED